MSFTIASRETPMAPQRSKTRSVYWWLSIPVFILTVSCSTMPSEPIDTVEHVDIQRFMGDWYVIGNIPTPIERDAHNAVESYRLAEDGTIETIFTFRKGSFDGPQKRYTPRGFIRDKKSNAEWGMQFIWPFKAEYLIVYLDENYSRTIIGRSKRDYVWIMSRSPMIADANYSEMVSFLDEQGYDTSLIQKVPQHWDQ